ncbi:MAG: hypothetical protein AB1716_13940 [Planctomycetota bacterium]
MSELRPRIVIAHAREDVVVVWAEVLAGVPSVEIRRASARDLLSDPRLQAVVLPAVMAHEKVGASPRASESQILSTQGQSLAATAPWIVTVPMREGRITGWRTVGKHQQPVIEPLVSVTPAELVVCQMHGVLRAVIDFNALKDAQERINTLGLDLGLLGIGRKDDGRVQAEALRDLLLSLPA